MLTSMLNNKGFSNIILIFSILILLGVLGSIFYFSKPVTIKSSGLISKESSNNTEKSENSITCATQEMFSDKPPVNLEPITGDELNNFYLIQSNYLNILNFYTFKDEGALIVPGTNVNSDDKLYISGKLVTGEPGSKIASTYVFQKANCIAPVTLLNGEIIEKITKLTVSKNNINIYKVPGCCTADSPDYTYFLELPAEYEKKINSKYIAISPYFYYENIEEIFRTFKFSKIEK